MEIIARVTSLEFHNTKDKCLEGAYEVVEHDGEINIAVVKHGKDVRWFDESEYAVYVETTKLEMMFDANMRYMDDHWLDDILDITEEQDYLNEGGDCSARRLQEQPLMVDKDEFPLKNKYQGDTKSLADLLREQWANGQ